MFKKGTKLYSIFSMKCPKCHEGEFFKGHPYNIKKVGELYAECSNCNEKYSKEPGFYYGAMYISYGITVGMFLAIWLAFTLVLPSYTPFQLVVVFSGIVVLLSPYLYALSKIIWANIFIKYDANKTPKVV